MSYKASGCLVAALSTRSCGGGSSQLYWRLIEAFECLMIIHLTMGISRGYDRNRMKHNLVDLDIHPSISAYREIMTTDVFQDLFSGTEQVLWYSLAYIIFAIEDQIESMRHET